MHDAEISSPSIPGTTKIWTDDGGSVRATGATPEECAAFDSLPAALDRAFEQGAHAIVKEGTYRYSEDVYLPSNCTVHFENATLHPCEGANGVHLGDGERNHVFNHVSGTVEIRPDRGSEPASTCILVDGGTKLMSWTARTDVRGGAADAAVRLEGAEQGSWWNDFSHVRIDGRTVKDTRGSTPANDFRFGQCVFRGDIDVRSGNAFIARNCAYEGIRIDLRAEADLDGRFEACDVTVAEGVAATIDASHWSDCTCETADPSLLTFEGNDATERSRDADSDNATLQRLVQHGAYTVDDEAVLELANTYSASGRNNLLRAVAAGRGDGYFLQGVDEAGDVDKEVEVEGDYRNETPGKGLVVRDAADGCRYRISTERGELVVDRV